MSRPVTEDDFRMPEYRGARLEDYEIRGDGKAVRKDRWETGIRRIRAALGDERAEFEIDDVVATVEALVDMLPDNPEVDDENA